MLFDIESKEYYRISVTLNLVESYKLLKESYSKGLFHWLHREFEGNLIYRVSVIIYFAERREIGCTCRRCVDFVDRKGIL